MYFQKVLKGISDLPDTEVDSMVNSGGIQCNWWRKKGQITPDQIQRQLTEPNVFFHLNHYGDPLPPGHPYAYLPGAVNYGDVTPYISTTAGVINRSAALSANILFPALITSLQFATQNFTVEGYIFYAYLLTLGKKAVPLWQFSEEVRELLIYQQFLPYYQEGEIVAKIHIPAAQIEKAEKYDGQQVLYELKRGAIPVPTNTIPNRNYTQPDQYSNIREYL